jgi:ATP/maltotriose-dependent transcriptional regulator MalT
MCSLAEIQLDQGELEAAERDARKALSLLAGRSDYLHEIGIAQLTIGRALLGRGKLEEAQQFFDAAEASFREIDSTGHQAIACIAKGDLVDRRGDTQRAAAFYRQAAVALQEPPR